MNLVLLAVLVAGAATQAAPPFQWEFDFRQCSHNYEIKYICFVGRSPNILAPTGYVHPLKRIDYQTHPHVVAISPQSPNKWSIIMQTRSNDKKVDLSFGLQLHRQTKIKDGRGMKIEKLFAGCRVDNGTLVLTSSADLDTELHDSYFNDYHIFCDFSVKPKEGSGKTLLDIVSKGENFGLALKFDGKTEVFLENYEYDFNADHYEYDDLQFISTFFHDLKRQKHDCDLSQVKFDPTEALAWGKVRPPKYFDNKFFCPDVRYAMYVTSSDGRRKDNAVLTCENGQYKVGDWFHIIDKEKYGAFTLKRNETINVVCYVEDHLLCPLSIPCYKDDCPYVTAKVWTSHKHYKPTEYVIKCENYFKSNLVVGKNESRFGTTNQVKCKDHELVVNRLKWYTYDKFKSPDAAATVGYCEKTEKSD